MTTRISPAASLLRNSKLFALPPTIALPPTPPSSDQIFSSDTATTIYPTHAAIQTTNTSLIRGDWGFKRPLPARAFTRTNNPVVRLVRGIDTPEHTADFESAADHSLTLRKFQELNHPLRHPTRGLRSVNQDRQELSVFRPTHDNTTNLSSSAPVHNSVNGVWPRIHSDKVTEQIPQALKNAQIEYDAGKKTDEDQSGIKALLESTSHTAFPRQTETKRWRYKGPSLSQMTGLEFDDYLESLGQKEKEMLLARIRKEVIREQVASATDAGNMNKAIREEDVTQEQIADYLRALRRDPRKFGPMIVEILDIPEGISTITPRQYSDAWEYGRETLASLEWTERGPPRTHPSAGLSYVHTNTHANNHPEYGPQRVNPAVLARAVKQRSRAGGSDATYGVAGFIVPKPEQVSIQAVNEQFQPREGGLKIPLRPGPAWITETGALRMQTIRSGEHDVDDDKAVFKDDKQRKVNERATQEALAQELSAPSMSGVVSPLAYESTRTQRSRFGQTDVRRQAKPDLDIDGILGQVGNMSRDRRKSVHL